MIDLKRVVYSLNVEDIQTVAEEDLGRLLTEREIKIVEHNLPGYIDWHQAISNALLFDIKLAEKETPT